MKLVSFFLSWVLACHAFAEGREGHGGDNDALEFVRLGKLAIKYIQLQQAQLSAPIILPEEELQQLRDIIAKVKVTVVEHRLCPIPDDFLCSDDYVARNYPRRLAIILSRPRWKKLSTNQRAKLALHEYLGIAGIERDTYQVVSSMIIPEGPVADGATHYQCQFSAWSDGMIHSGGFRLPFIGYSGFDVTLSPSRKTREAFKIKGSLGYNWLAVQVWKADRRRNGKIHPRSWNKQSPVIPVFHGHVNGVRFFSVPGIRLQVSCGLDSVSRIPSWVPVLDPQTLLIP